VVDNGRRSLSRNTAARTARSENREGAHDPSAPRTRGRSGRDIGDGPIRLGQKAGGILKVYSIDSPPTMSILEEATLSSEAPLMGLFNNLIMFDQHVKQDSLASIVPDLATGWNWSEDGTAVTFPLRQGVKWHDGKPFTAADVKCTWDLLMEKSSDKLRFNPRKSFYKNPDLGRARGAPLVRRGLLIGECYPCSQRSNWGAHDRPAKRTKAARWRRQFRSAEEIGIV
jgi:hypothetical protein